MTKPKPKGAAHDFKFIPSWTKIISIVFIFAFIYNSVFLAVADNLPANEDAKNGRENEVSVKSNEIKLKFDQKETNNNVNNNEAPNNQNTNNINSNEILPIEKVAKTTGDKIAGEKLNKKSDKLNSSIQKNDKRLVADKKNKDPTVLERILTSLVRTNKTSTTTTPAPASTQPTTIAPMSTIISATVATQSTIIAVTTQAPMVTVTTQDPITSVATRAPVTTVTIQAPNTAKTSIPTKETTHPSLEGNNDEPGDIVSIPVRPQLSDEKSFSCFKVCQCEFKSVPATINCNGKNLTNDNLPNFDSVSLNENDKNRSFNQFVSDNNSALSLSLSRNNLTKLDWKLWKQLMALKPTKLDLSYNQINEIVPIEKELTIQNQRLKILDLSFNNLTQLSVKDNLKNPILNGVQSSIKISDNPELKLKDCDSTCQPLWYEKLDLRLGLHCSSPEKYIDMNYFDTFVTIHKVKLCRPSNLLFGNGLDLQSKLSSPQSSPIFAFTHSVVVLLASMSIISVSVLVGLAYKNNRLFIPFRNSRDFDTVYYTKADFNNLDTL